MYLLLASSSMSLFAVGFVLCDVGELEGGNGGFCEAVV